MKSDVVFMLCLSAALLGAASGLTVGPVRLPHNRAFISYTTVFSRNLTLIECPYSLSEGEEVAKVHWAMWDGEDQVGTYEWRPGTGGSPGTGRLEGVVELNRGDAGLELIKLRYDLASEYSCSVLLTDGQMKDSAGKEEVLIIDISGDTSFTKNSYSCQFVTSFQSSAVFPEPTLHAGMFLNKSNQFYEYEEVSSKDWLKFVYPNGSVAYSYNNVSFKIDENSPKGLVFKLRMGVTKTDGTYIFLSSFSGSSSSWEDGCPDVKEENFKEVHYFPGSSSLCRGGRSKTTKATMTCKRGYRSAGPVGIVVMRCSGTTLAWQPEEGQTATFEDLTCVKDDGRGDGDGNKAAVSSGSPSLALVCTSIFSIALLALGWQ